MVHRPADSRLLTNVLSHEKEYAKQLQALLDSSQASLASFTAYAAASPPPTSQTILKVAGILSAADSALAAYAAAVDQWREAMRALQALEDEVGNIVRDREILCVRRSFLPCSCLTLSQRHPSYKGFKISKTYRSSWPTVRLIFVPRLSGHPIPIATAHSHYRDIYQNSCGPIRIAGMRNAFGKQGERARTA